MGSQDADESEESAESSDSDDFEDECAGLEGAECSERYDDEGNPECALNRETNTCYGITQAGGVYGKGNFDDGYVAAQNEANEEADSLSTIIGVLGGFVGALVLLIAGGGFYFYSKNKRSDYAAEADEMEMEMAGMDTEQQTLNVDDEAQIMTTR